MFETIIVVVISFFAVIGVIECLMCLLEKISTSGYSQPSAIDIKVSLSGEIDNISFLLNTLLLQAERIDYNSCVTRVVIVDKGIGMRTYTQIENFCNTNDNIFVEKQENM